MINVRQSAKLQAMKQISDLHWSSDVDAWCHLRQDVSCGVKRRVLSLGFLRVGGNRISMQPIALCTYNIKYAIVIFPHSLFTPQMRNKIENVNSKSNLIKTLPELFTDGKPNSKF
jgi:hypothetical protein